MGGYALRPLGPASHSPAGLPVHTSVTVEMGLTLSVPGSHTLWAAARSQAATGQSPHVLEKTAGSVNWAPGCPCWLMTNLPRGSCGNGHTC